MRLARASAAKRSGPAEPTRRGDKRSCFWRLTPSPRQNNDELRRHRIGGRRAAAAGTGRATGARARARTTRAAALPSAATLLDARHARLRRHPDERQRPRAHPGDRDARECPDADADPRHRRKRGRGRAHHEGPARGPQEARPRAPAKTGAGEGGAERGPAGLRAPVDARAKIAISVGPSSLPDTCRTTWSAIPHKNTGSARDAAAFKQWGSSAAPRGRARQPPPPPPARPRAAP